MTTRRDPDRLIRAFLAEGQTDLPDRSYDAVRSQIERTRQRVVFGPWRLTPMNTYVKLAIAAAAVVVVAVVGINLLPAGNGGIGGPGPTASPTPSPSPSPSPTPTAAPTPGPTTVAAFPPLGPIAAGTHTAVLEGMTVSFTVPADGWLVSQGNFIGTKSYGNPSDVSFDLWPSSPDNIYSDPCGAVPMSPPPAHTAAGLAAAAASIPGTQLLSGPTSVTVGGKPAQYVSFTIPNDLPCDPHTFRTWYDDSAGTQDWRWAGNLGAIAHVWTIDVDGTVIWFNAETWASPDPVADQAVTDFITSITFE
jgi:hypothetical protein